MEGYESIPDAVCTLSGTTTEKDMPRLLERLVADVAEMRRGFTRFEDDVRTQLQAVLGLPASAQFVRLIPMRRGAVTTQRHNEPS